MLENSARHNAPQVSLRKLSRGMDLTEKAIRDRGSVANFSGFHPVQHWSNDWRSGEADSKRCSNHTLMA